MMRVLKNLYHLLQAFIACLVYGFPGKKLIIIGITGTDGKTTTTSLIHHILQSSGYKTGRMTTVDAQIGNEIISSSLHTTTANSFALQKFLKLCVEQKCKYVVLEVSSHGIDQQRIWGIDFEVGVLTNIANNEHLDYHGSFENYKNAKTKFVQSCKHSIIKANGLTKMDFSFETKLIGKFNEENCLSAISACKTLNISDSDIRNALKTFIPPPGRLEVVQNKPFKIIIDFAHTPQAFERVLPTVKDLLGPKGKLIHVFGATGNRDKSKREIMAKIAVSYDDYIFLTHEDTYNEDPKSIIDQLEKGLIVANYRNYRKVMKRREAIEEAIRMAKSDDVVIITGVGHQKTMNVGGVEIEWNDADVVRELL